MSQRPTTRSIASYFQPATRAPSATPPAASPSRQPQPQSHSQPAAPSSPASKLTSLPPSSPPPAFSSPAHVRTTPKPKPQRADVIEASDDEGGFGDDDSDGEDFEDIMDLLKPAAASAPDPCATPQAKRTAVRDGFFRSAEDHAAAPRHRLDLAALARDARRDEATSASSLRNQAAAAAAARNTAPSRADKDPLGGVLGDVVKDHDGRDAHKVLRTVQRTDLAKTQAWCCFFDRDYRAPPGAPAPRPGRASPWRLLTQGTAAERERNLASGVPQTLVATRGGGLPDDVFQWILDELCVSRSSLARIEYCNIVADCPEQVAQLLAPERLRALFLRLGASDELESPAAELTVSRPSHNPYQDRDWSCVASFLSLLDAVADSLSTASAVYAIRVLLRMAFDKIVMCSIDLLPAWDAAVNRLASAIPPALWDSFCLETCSLLHASIKEQFLRTNALLCLSPRNPASHDLRRRLAAAYLFDDPSIARQHPDDVITLRRAAELLEAADFAISKRTDFAELKARTILLDIVVDDGCAPAAEEAARAFDADIDELARRLEKIGKMIDDSGMRLERTEAKTALKWVQMRVLHSVRTKRQPRKNVYEGDVVSDASLPRQQEMMRNFVQRT
ncbi:hypothetical protein ESCO_005709 [Escovopsis weberi]|uniref:Uncharacterized protein n=1 Tax=Escovopsis weberi TaxID=150374 RepID=A0A0M9VUL9_ESCWE|nr:hypothetical protein ESCO_005709 [Escovopsis weberi]